MHAVRRTRRMHAALAAHAAHLPSKRMATRRCALEQVHARELLGLKTRATGSQDSVAAERASSGVEALVD